MAEGKSLYAINESVRSDDRGLLRGKLTTPSILYHFQVLGAPVLV